MTRVLLAGKLTSANVRVYEGEFKDGQYIGSGESIWRWLPGPILGCCAFVYLLVRTTNSAQPPVPAAGGAASQAQGAAMTSASATGMQAGASAQGLQARRPITTQSSQQGMQVGTITGAPTEQRPDGA